MTTNSAPLGAHLVGSVPLANESEVFELSAALLGKHLRRFPDGETSERLGWTGWQFPLLARCPQLEAVAEPDRPQPRIQLRAGGSPAEVRLGPLGYASAAARSYATFVALRDRGVLPVAARFQVCLPTPLAPIGLFVVAHDQGALEPVRTCHNQRVGFVVFEAVMIDRLVVGPVRAEPVGDAVVGARGR